MLRGYLAGGFWGTIVGGGAITVASLVADQPAGNTPPAAPQVSVPQTQAATPADQTTPQDVAPDMQAPAVEQTPSLAVSDQADPADGVIADTTPADVPQTAEVAVDPQVPEETAAAPAIVAAPEEPVLPNPQSVAPQVPMTEQDLTVSTAPAAPVPPVEVAEPQAETETETETETVAEDVTADGPKSLDIKVPQPAPQAIVVIDDPAPEVTIVPDAAAGLPSGDDAVAVNRPASQSPAPEPTPEAPEKVVDPDAPALEKFGSTFEFDAAKPLIGLLLLDDGSMDGGSSVLTSLPFPVTVVLDPAQPDAAARLAAYRAAGIEVGVQIALPAGATPADVEVALSASFAALPETVMLVDAGDGGLQNDRSATAQAMEVLAQDGRGLVTVSKGLNMALRAAEQAEVPASVIYRDLDADGQDARVIRRFLDQAAFRARQESGVLLLARLRPDTISALVLWGTANRAGQVAVAPVSQILLAQE